MEEKKVKKVDKTANYEKLWKAIASDESKFVGKERVESYLKRLTPREEKVLSMRFALGDYDRRYTLQEVGETMMIGRERVREIEAKALQKMRKYSAFNLSSEEELDRNLEDIKTKINEGKSISINEIGLSARAFTCLKRAGYNNVEDLANTTMAELNRVRGLTGEKCIAEIESKLKKLGLSFKAEEHKL